MADPASSAALALIRAKSVRLPHALILSGGEDRLAAARYAACAYECTSGGQKPCLACENCRKVLEDIHPDVITVRDDEHVEIAVEIVRDVRSDAFILPNEGARKVYLFPDCDALNEKDQNVLLKVVEEGPPYAAFVFCARNSAVLLPTIRSRCVELRTGELGVAASDEKAEALCRLLAEGDRAARASYLVKLEAEKPSREELAALFDAVRALFAAALRSLYGIPDAGKTTPLITSRLTKGQIIGTIDILETYRKHCDYNVGVGALLGGLAAELEEIL